MGLACGLQIRKETMSKIDKYKIEIFYNDEDQCFIANVPEIQSCSAHGPTHEETLKEIKVALAGVLEVMGKYEK